MNIVNKEIINILKDRTPKEENTVDMLMQIIPISKEAAYRRLRGDIAFTLEEAITICKKLNLSLDFLSGTSKEGIYAFHLDAILSENPMAEYQTMLVDIIEAVTYMSQDPDSLSYRAQRTLPQEFLFKYESLSRVYIIVLYYQLLLQSTPSKLVELDIPDFILPLQKKIVETMHNINSILIIDKRVFVDFIEIVKYFSTLDMISQNEMIQIKKDLHLMLNDMEQCASTGKSLAGFRLDMYICNISFDCTYEYIEGAGTKASSLGVYCINNISSINPYICDMHKRWINSLIRYSYLISVSGEHQRNEFFHNQRNFVDSML